jgi:hypothetical protein
LPSDAHTGCSLGTHFCGQLIEAGFYFHKLLDELKVGPATSKVYQWIVSAAGKELSVLLPMNQQRCRQQVVVSICRAADVCVSVQGTVSE